MRFSPKTQNAYHTTGAAKLVGLTMTAGTWIAPLQEPNQAIYTITLSGTAATTIRAQVEISDDGSTSMGPLPAINSIATGVVDQDDMVFDIPITTANPHVIICPIPPGFYTRLSMIRVNGDGTTAALAKVAFAKV